MKDVEDRQRENTVNFNSKITFLKKITFLNYPFKKALSKRARSMFQIIPPNVFVPRKK